MGYKEKLQAFNKGASYNEELRFLSGILNTTQGEIVIDYGCGTGYGVDQVKANGHTNLVFGYDSHNYRDDFYPESYFVDRLPEKINKVYFMHSYSHIPDVKSVLRNIHSKMSEDGKIYIITPNPTWLKTFNNKDYVSDTTVVKHKNHYEIFHDLDDSGFNLVLEGQLGNLRSGVHERIFAIYQKKYE